MRSEELPEELRDSTVFKHICERLQKRREAEQSKMGRWRDRQKVCFLSRPLTLSSQPRKCKGGVGTTLWMSSSGPARAPTWPWSNISGDTLPMIPIRPDRSWEDLQIKIAENRQIKPYACKTKLNNKMTYAEFIEQLPLIITKWSHFILGTNFN